MNLQSPVWVYVKIRFSKYDCIYSNTVTINEPLSYKNYIKLILLYLNSSFLYCDGICLWSPGSTWHHVP